MAVQLLGRIDSPLSTQTLVHLVLEHRLTLVVDAALLRLKGRIPRDFMDGLIGSLRPSIPYRVKPVGPNGEPGMLVMAGRGSPPFPPCTSIKSLRVLDAAQVTARAPSPTANATRFVVPLRTSPAAKTPGHVVSTVQGSRSVRGQRSDFAASAPVRMKPLESTAMLGGIQSVLGSRR